MRRLALFGPILRADFDASGSDVDVVVEFDPQLSGKGLREYFELKAELEALFRRPVDLVELGAMENTRLKRIIERTQVPLQAAAAGRLSGAGVTGTAQAAQIPAAALAAGRSGG